MTKTKLTPQERALVIALCENNLRISGAAEDLRKHRNTITYQCKTIKKKTGLDPRDFHDAQALLAKCWDERKN